MFTDAEQSIIKEVIKFERVAGHPLPDQSFYKSIALAAARRLGFSWNQITQLF